MAYDYQLLEVVISGRIATVTINNPPINIITPALYQELVALVAELKDDDSLTVIVFKGAEPRFFHRPLRRIEYSEISYRGRCRAKPRAK